ncbi:fibronectin type III domain-containing protein [Streptomyces sp. NPDC050085]|uniref:fibronectin type III domain-containing protein n=1 Tax=Streptomyces sp. NPDC050085 TaxID=3365600 RepID=UPI0037BAB318
MPHQVRPTVRPARLGLAIATVTATSALVLGLTGTAATAAPTSGTAAAAYDEAGLGDGPSFIMATGGRDAVTLSWSWMSEAAHYEVYRASEETGETGDFSLLATVDQAVSPEYADTDAWEDVPYAYKVRAVDAYGNTSDFSETVHATRDTTAPLSPTDLTVAKQDVRGVTLTWRSGGTDAVKYNVYRSTSVNGTAKKLGWTSTLTYRDTTGEPGQTYVYFVRGLDAAGNESASSPYVTATKSIGSSSAPQAPTFNSALIVGNKLSLAWQSNGYVPVQQFHVYRSRTTPVDTTNPANLVTSTDQTSYTQTVADSDKDYYYAVVAESAYGVRSAASASQLPEVRAPQPPPSTTIYDAAAGDGQAVLSWYDPPFSTDQPPFAGYRLYRSTSPGVTPATADKVIPTTDSSYPDYDVTNGTTYYYVVTVVDTDGNESAPSPEVSVTPVAP